MFLGLPQVKRHAPEVCLFLFRATLARLRELKGHNEIRPVVVLGLILLLSPIAPLALGADDGIRVLTDRPEGSALNIEIEGRCSEVEIGMPEAMVRWRIDAGRAPEDTYIEDLKSSGQFRLDVSKFPEGLERGLFESLTTSRSEAARVSDLVDNLKSDGPSDSLAIVIADLEPGVFYRTRILALTPDGWIASPEVHFMSPVCAVDGLDEIEGGVR